MKRLALCALLLAVPVWAHDPPKDERHPAPPTPARPAAAPEPEPAERPAAAIRGDMTVPPYKLVRQTAANVPEKSGVLWKVRPLDERNEVDWASRQNVRSIEWVAPPGRYRVELYVVRVLADGAPELDIAETLVTIGEPAPPPAPAPPTPPPIPPAPPPPSDAFQLALQRAYAEDPTPDKAARVDQLAALYRVAAASTVRDPALATAGALVAKLRAALANLGFGDQTIAKVRRTVADELNRQFALPDTAPLDAALRDKYAAAFADLAARLGGIKR